MRKSYRAKKLSVKCYTFRPSTRACLLVKSHQLHRLWLGQRTFTECVCSKRPVTAVGTCFYGRSLKHVPWGAFEQTLRSISRIDDLTGCRFHWESVWVQREWAACHSFSMKQDQSHYFECCSFFRKSLGFLLTGLLFQRNIVISKRSYIRLFNTQHNESVIFKNYAPFAGGLWLLINWLRIEREEPRKDLNHFFLF